MLMCTATWTLIELVAVLMNISLVGSWRGFQMRSMIVPVTMNAVLNRRSVENDADFF